MSNKLNFDFLRWRDVIIVVILLPMIAYSLIVVSKELPERRYIYKISQAVNDGSITTSNYYKIPQGFTDNWSNCSSLIEGTKGYPRNVFATAAEGVYLGECPRLVTLMKAGWTDEGITTSSFDQYWHGYQVIEKPLVTIFGYMFACIILLIAYLWLLIRFVKRSIRQFIPRLYFLITIILTTDFLLLYTSIPQAIWQITALAIPLTLGEILINHPHSKKINALMNIAAGFLSWYFDFGFALGVSLIIWIFYIANTPAVKNHNDIIVINYRGLAMNALTWLSGVAYAMFSHTLIVGLFRGFHYAFSHIFSRFSDDTALNQKSTLFSGIGDTLKFYMHTEFFFLSICLILTMTIFTRQKMKKRVSNTVKLRIASGMTFLVILYLVATSAVSSYHSWLAQRIWGWLLALTLAVWSSDRSLKEFNFLRR